MGMQEVLIIVGLGVLVFGAGRLPQLGQAMGKAIRNFKTSISGDDEIDVTSRAQVEPGEEDEQDKQDSDKRS